MLRAMRILPFVVAVAAAGYLGGCGGGYHAREVGIEQDRDKLTLGAVQRSISKGMTQDKVVEAMGSPNIVTTDEQGRESWVYDRQATQVVSSGSAGGTWLVFWGDSGASSATSKTQRSLTVVIKYDEAKRVRDVAYHSSSF